MVVESQAVDQRVSGREAEHPGLGVTGLRLWGHGTHFDEAKTHLGKGINAPRIFIKTSRQANSVRKTQPSNCHGVIDARLCIGQAQGRVLGCCEASQREVMRGLGIQAE